MKIKTAGEEAAAEETVAVPQDAKQIIVEALKEAGLELGEDVAMAAAKTIWRVLPKVAVATENKVDDLLVPVLTVLEPTVMDLLDKIDKKEG